MTGPAAPCPGQHDLAPAPADPIWCSPCGRAITDRLTDLPDLVGLLEQEIGGQGGTGGDAPVTGSKGSPSPSPVVDDIDEITRTLEYWEDAHRELADLPRRNARRYGGRVGASARWLTAHIGDVLAAPWAEEFGRDVNRLHARARRSTHTDAAKVRKPLPCPRCDLKALWWSPGERYISCSECGRLMTLGEYEDWSRDLVAAEQVGRTA